MYKTKQIKQISQKHIERTEDEYEQVQHIQQQGKYLKKTSDYIKTRIAINGKETDFIIDTGSPITKLGKISTKH